MKDRCFVDSNVWLYLLQDDEAKKQVALRLLGEASVISTQVLSENTNVCLRKFKMSVEDTRMHLSFLQHHTAEVLVIMEATIHKALDIKARYQYGFYDSLIIASALELDCTILYSEDMQDGQLIEGKLRIKNPFL